MPYSVSSPQPSPMDMLLYLQIILTLLALFLLRSLLNILLVIRNHKGNSKLAPEPCGAWPLFGHLHLLKEKIPACRVLGAMADKYGPIFTIRIGMKRALVISSWEAVKDCFKTNDHVFMTRPRSAASEIMGYNGALFGLAPYGTYWRETRKIATLELLSNRRLELLKNLRASEVETSIKDLYSLCTSDKSSSAMVDMDKWFASTTMNVMIRMITGKRHFGSQIESDRFCKAIKSFMYLSGVFVMSDVIPFTRWLDMQGYLRSMKSTAKDLDHFMSSWLEEHVQRRRNEEVKEERDFIDVMLSLLADEDSSERVIKATALNLIIGGTDTTSVTLTWALSLLLNHPEVLKHAQDELDNEIGKKRWAEESDLRQLPYLQAIIKETLRLYPPGPLSVPRESTQYCYIGGYYVPKGTTLLVNLWKLHRDPRVWTNPCEFQPERFLNSHPEFDVRGQNVEFIPFGIGKRSCPGISSAMQMASLVLGRVLQGFHLSTPMNAPIDMGEDAGLTLPKATPLEVVLVPRLECDLYQL